MRNANPACVYFAFWLIQECRWSLGMVVPGGRKNNTSALFTLTGLKVLKWNHLLGILRNQRAKKGRRIWWYSHTDVYTVHPGKNISSQSACSFSNMLACSTTSASPTSVTHRRPTSIFQSTVAGVDAEAYENTAAWTKETRFGHRRGQTSTRFSNNDKHVWNKWSLALKGLPAGRMLYLLWKRGRRDDFHRWDRLIHYVLICGGSSLTVNTFAFIGEHLLHLKDFPMTGNPAMMWCSIMEFFVGLKIKYNQTSHKCWCDGF